MPHMHLTQFAYLRHPCRRLMTQFAMRRRFSKVAKELDVVLPVSFFEKANNAFYNSLVVIDADGSIASHYRKSHIPDGPGYQVAALPSQILAGLRVTVLPLWNWHPASFGSHSLDFLVSRRKSGTSLPATQVGFPDYPMQYTCGTVPGMCEWDL